MKVKEIAYSGLTRTVTYFGHIRKDLEFDFQVTKYDNNSFIMSQILYFIS
jgi:hypothetical protein